jgi:hypothetical protein
MAETKNSPVRLPAAQVVRHPATQTAASYSDPAAMYREIAARVVIDDHAFGAFMHRCEMLAAAGIYGHKCAETVAVAALKGMSMGYDMITSLTLIKVIHGTPSIRGPQALALIKNRVHKGDNGDECIESTPERCVWVLRRPGHPERTFTLLRSQIPEAQIAKNTLWKSYPARLLKWQCYSEGAQEIYADILLGTALTEAVEADPEDDADDVPYAEAPRSRPAAPPPRRDHDVVDVEVDEGPRPSRPAQETPAYRGPTPIETQLRADLTSRVDAIIADMPENERASARAKLGQEMVKEALGGPKSPLHEDDLRALHAYLDRRYPAS